MRKIQISFGAICLALLVSLSATSQEKKPARQGVWTRLVFEDRHTGNTENPHLRRVRASSQSAFDRVVFEFEGATPNYIVEYLTSRFYVGEDGPSRIRIAGQSFIKVDLYQLSADEKQGDFSNAKGFYPKGKLRLPSLMAMEDIGVGEGHYEFLLGIRSRKLFRVTELANPSRVVIDIRH